MNKFSIVFFIIYIPCMTFSQVRGVIINMENLFTDSLKYYYVTIINENDSVLCLTHSAFLNLKTSKIQILSPLIQDSVTEYYTLLHSIEDDYLDPAIAVYRGVCILPYQAKNFTIAVPVSDKSQHINFNFFFKIDYSHSIFMREICKRGWYRKYDVFSIQKLL